MTCYLLDKYQLIILICNYQLFTYCQASYKYSNNKTMWVGGPVKRVCANSSVVLVSQGPFPGLYNLASNQ